MASITTWTRLETRQRTEDLDVALAARVHDPLWLLARQWQMGEFRGRDAGSPVIARMRAAVGRLDRYLAGRPGEDGPSRSRPYEDARVPLEAVVEGESLSPSTAPRVVIEAGAHLLRMLQAAGLGRYRPRFVEAFPAHAAIDAGGGPQGARFRDLVARRLPDGLALRGALEAAGGSSLPEGIQVDRDDEPAVLDVVRRWLRWFDAFPPSTSSDEAWVPARLEHSFAVAATVAASERVLTSEDYASGTLEWHDFDVASGVSLGSQAASQAVTRTVVPAPVTYPGMPAPRWWEFEDAKVDLGSVTAGPDDVARLLMVGFAVDYGNDWFVVPIELPVGSLTRMESVEVTDTFGVAAHIRSAADVDGAGARWRMFALSGDDGDELLLPPVLATSLESEVRERVTLVRDELANLVWAVEDVVDSATGTPHRREEEPRPPGRPRGIGTGILAYEVATAVARHWHPLITVADDGDAAVLEQRALHPAVGTLLGAAQPLRVFEEEVPGEGLGVERTYQSARWLGGRAVLWSGRRRSAGRGPTSSGLRFDDVRRAGGEGPG